jgi:hypothetical protein
MQIRIHQRQAPVFRIRDILGRIWILGSVPLTTDNKSGDSYPVQIQLRIFLLWSVTFKTPRKKNIFPKIYAISFLKVHLDHSSKIKSHKKVTKQKKSRFFFIFWLVDGRIQIRIRTNKLRIQETQNHMVPTNPDREH